jgi:tRNA pseudouridine38-40 synthase
MAAASAIRWQHNWKITLEYDGRRYAGWQQQPQARTIQGELAQAVRRLVGPDFELMGAGRTDAGVHALGQVAHLKTLRANNDLLWQLNAELPPDINILQIQPVALKFHARHDALARHYLYQIATKRTAFGKNYVWWVKDTLDAPLMQQACQQLIGLQDFKSFCESSEGSTLVKVEQAQLTLAADRLLFRIAASHFLWKMVRRIVGALVEIGRGKLSLKQFARLFQITSPEVAAWTAPPSGLFLEQVVYPGNSEIVAASFATVPLKM